MQPVYQQTTVTTTGLPTWMHVMYAVGGIFTCGLMWIAWGIHWWVVQSQSKSTTIAQGRPPTYPTY